MNLTQHLRNEVLKTEAHIPLSGITAYHLIQGNLALANSVITSGMATTLYTGNGTTQSVVTGVDIATQWGNSVTETLGGLVWVTQRSGAVYNMLADTIRGVNNLIYTNTTTAQEAVANTITNFNSNGFSVGINAGTNTAINTNLATYASWVFQTTHRITGTTNHGKAYTCHYNPFTGFTIVKYEGSGLAGHEIPHYLGRKLALQHIKNLSVAANWISQTETTLLKVNLTDAGITGSMSNSNATTTILTADVNVNGSTNQHILYGWADSYFDANNTLIGNYELVSWHGSGVAGNKVQTRGKPAAIIGIKRTDSTSNWTSLDNQRVSGVNDNALYVNLSNAEVTGTDYVSWLSDGFSINTTGADYNALGGSYIALVVYDNDNGSGKSKYPMATDTSTLNLNATIPFANGVDVSGTKNTILTKNETVTGLTFTEGRNYVYAKNNGTYGTTPAEPKYLGYNGFGDYFDVNSNQWYQSPSVFGDDFSTNTLANYSLFNVTAVIANGTVTLTNTSTNYGSIFTTVYQTVTAGQKYRAIWKNTGLVRVYISDSVSTLADTGYSSTLSSIDFTASSTGQARAIFGVGTNASGASCSFNDFAIYPINDDGSVDTSSATSIAESRNYLDAVVYADAGGQPYQVVQLPKTEYKDSLEVRDINVVGGFDLNQSIYDLTGLKFSGITYYNGNKPKHVYMYTTTVAIVAATGTIDGKDVARFYNPDAANSKNYIYLYVPPFSSYKITVTAGAIESWKEIY